MATSEEKQQTVDALKGTRFYRIQLLGYGGEAAYININKEAYEFWNAHVEEHGDSDLVEYMISDYTDEGDYDELEVVPKEVDFLSSYGKEDYKSQWYEAPGEFLHQSGVEYGSAYLTVEEMSSDDYMADTIAEIFDSKSVSELVDFINEETDYETEISDFGEPDEFEPQGNYVAQFYSSEKGCFFAGRIQTVGEFDPKKLKFVVNEYPNGEDIIDSVLYDDVEVDNDGGDTNGKGYSAHVWKNV